MYINFFNACTLAFCCCARVRSRSPRLTIFFYGQNIDCHLWHARRALTFFPRPSAPGRRHRRQRDGQGRAGREYSATPTVRAQSTGTLLARRARECRCLCLQFHQQASSQPKAGDTETAAVIITISIVIAYRRYGAKCERERTLYRNFRTQSTCALSGSGSKRDERDERDFVYLSLAS